MLFNLDLLVLQIRILSPYATQLTDDNARLTDQEPEPTTDAK